ncbi:MAG TPA: response regulator [Planctomycetota bacterium]|nr:response regulator [Planctomycetota bacterium]
MRILLIDDSRAMRRMERGVIEELGFKDIFEAENGNDAIQKLALYRFQVDLILCDWNMPVMDGLSFAHQMKSRPNLAVIPIVMVTSESDRAKIDQAIQIGVDGYIIKPFTADILRKVIQDIRDGRKVADSPAVEQLRRLPTAGRKATALFNQISATSEQKIKELAEVKFVTPGTVLAAQGQPVTAFQFVLVGNVDAVDAQGQVLESFGPGTCYGELELLTSEPAHASYRASTTTTVGQILGTDLDTVLMTQPEFATALTRYMASRAGRPGRGEVGKPSGSGLTPLSAEASAYGISLGAPGAPVDSPSGHAISRRLTVPPPGAATQTQTPGKTVPTQAPLPGTRAATPTSQASNPSGITRSKTGAFPPIPARPGATPARPAGQQDSTPSLPNTTGSATRIPVGNKGSGVRTPVPAGTETPGHRTWEGTLDVLTLPELLQTLQVGHKTGDMHLEGFGMVGVITVENGKVVGSQFMSANGERGMGEDSFMKLLTANMTAFRFSAGISTLPRNISADATSLILEAMRRIDEQKR